MGTDPRGVVGLFTDPALAAAAIDALRQEGLADVRTQAPAPYPELELALRQRPSRLGIITFCGAVAGFCGGLALTIGTSIDLPMIVGGKPTISILPYLVVVFECTILVAGLSNFAAVVLGALHARRTRPVRNTEAATVDLVAVFVPSGDLHRAAKVLAENGATEVRS